VDGNGVRGAESVLQGGSATMFQLASTDISLTVSGFKLVGDTVLLGGGIGQEVTFTNNVLEIVATKDNVFHLGQTGGYDFAFTGNKVDVTGYTEFFQLFQGGSIDVSGNSFTGHAGTYVAGDDNNVPLIVNANGATGTVNNNVFDNIDIGVLVAGTTGPLEIAGNSFSNLHRVPGTTTGGNAAGVVFFAPAFAGTINIHDNSFAQSDAGIRTSGVPGTDLIDEPVLVDDNSFVGVANPVLVTIPGSIYATDSTIDAVSVPSSFYGGPDANSFAGTALADAMFGGGGNDTLAGAAGNDTLNGGNGSDTAIFSGSRLDYTFGGNTTSATSTDTAAGRDGTDQLVGIEKVTFTEQGRTFTLDAILNNVEAVIGDLSNSTVLENASVGASVGTVMATDENEAGGDFLTYSLSTNPGGLFAIDAQTGEITVAKALDAETAQSHDIVVKVTDAGGKETTKGFTINVGDVNEFAVTTPVDTNNAANSVAEELGAGALVGITAFASDADATTNVVTYSLQNDAGSRFLINSATGVVTTARLFDEADLGAHDIVVRATSADGSFKDATFSISINDVAEAPVITSNGGGASDTINVAEGLVAVTTVTATDEDVPSTLTYSIVGGADAARFNIHATTGVVTFKVAPDFENPTDSDGKNDYELIVQVSDGVLTDTQALTVNVTNAGETQTFFLTAGNDTFPHPTNGPTLSDDNFIVDGLGGDDIITTAGGNDVIRGSAGNDTISSGGGNDVIVYVSGNNGADAVDGGDGDDEIRAQSHGAVIGLSSVANVERITSNGFNMVRIVGSALADTLNFSSVQMVGITAIDGGAGNDVITGSAGDDTIIGGLGNDTLAGGEGNDSFILLASAGIDSIDGGGGTADRITFSGLNTSLTWNDAAGVQLIRNIELVDGTGATGTGGRILGSAMADRIDLSLVQLINIRNIDAGAGADTVIGSAGDDTIIGGSGADNLAGGGGNDTFMLLASSGLDVIDGGDGNADKIVLSGANASLSWTDANGVVLIGNVEVIDGTGTSGTGGRILGSATGDTIDLGLVQLININSIDAGAGADNVIGSNGNDTIIGGSGNDVLSGGAGDDVFLIAAGAGVDTIHGGLAGSDSGYDVIRATAANVAISFGSWNGIEEVSGGAFSNVRIIGTNAGEIMI
jgi:Ca2+-binding RTX toxin-like protein